MELRIEHLYKSFGRHKILQDLSLSFTDNQVIALLGPNGSGKTTFLKCLLGMVIPDKGNLLLDGKDITKDTHFRQRVGYMPQIGRYPENMKVSQLFDMMGDLRKGQNKQDTDLVEIFEIGKFMNKGLGNLSGGMKQKVGAALAFLFQPDILILDEPTAGLDPFSSELFKEKIIKEKAKGKLVIITSHILSDLDELATDLVYLVEGQVKIYSPLNELKTQTGEGQLGKALARIIEQEKTQPLIKE